MSAEGCARWGRITFTGQNRPKEPAGWEEGNAGAPVGRRPPGLADGFGPQFDDYLQAMYAHALQQARDFVEFVAPGPGTVVIEVGAGAGRIAFDGGLAERLGASGQLLLTDPSAARLDVCVHRAQAMRMPWVRVMRAEAESVPVETDTADLVLAVSVLQFTDQRRSIPEMVRILKSGGRVAISTGLDFVWSPPWWDALAPVRAALARHGHAYRPYLPTSHELHVRLEGLGLRLDRFRAFTEETLVFPDADLAIGLWRQGGLIPLLLRPAPGEDAEAVQDAFDARVRAMFAATTPEERRLRLTVMDLIATKP